MSNIIPLWSMDMEDNEDYESGILDQQPDINRPAFVYQRETYVSHASDPIRKKEDIDRICEYYLENGCYRKNMMFVVAINTGLRYSDLRTLRFSDFIGQDLKFKEYFDIIAQKTRSKREKSGSKQNQRIYINKAVKEAILLFLSHRDTDQEEKELDLNDLIFVAESRGCIGLPLGIGGFRYMLRNTLEALGIQCKSGAHTTRKTFSHAILTLIDESPVGYNPKSITFLRKALGHASEQSTLHYAGISQEEMKYIFNAINLGFGVYKRVKNLPEYNQVY